jgi:polysaccharide deacetylase 2 family uncharacterized protein YibQ
MLRKHSRGFWAVAADDLSAPLGQDVKKRRFVPPIRISHGIAGVLGLALLIFAGWVVFADDPFGGEPMIVVSADPRAPPQVGKHGDSARPGGSDNPQAAVANPTGAAQPSSANSASQPGAGDPAASTAAGAEKPPSAGPTITIIDGMSGKRQEVAIAAGDSKAAAAPGVDQRVSETSRHGAIPKIAPDGARAADVYARPIKGGADKAGGPRVAIVMGGLGIGAAGTFEAFGKLPGPVTFAFAPYGADLARWVARARGEGHEVMLQVPMEPFDYPDNDPGPQTLLTTLSAVQNIDRLHWFMSRIQGYVGIANYMGARFSASEGALGPMLRETAKRGLIYFDDGSSPRSVAGQIAGANSAPFVKADITLDAVPTQAGIDGALSRLEALARERGVAVGFASALPASIERLSLWVKEAESRGILLVPISMVAGKPKQT